MKNSDKTICRMTAALLSAYGVEDVVLCPGSRNAPLIMTVMRHSGLNPKTFVDERTAACAALGMAVQTRRPVAVVVTSGSAVLDTAPAVAEAYYRNIPLIIISADRPRRWIDQADSQTIRQNGALANIVRATVDVDDNEGDVAHWNRLLNDALTAATTGRKGPVHINVHLDMPLTGMCEVAEDETFTKFETIEPEGRLTTHAARELGRRLAPDKKVLVVAGGMQPDRRISRALARLAAIPNFTVFAEAQANVHAPGVISDVDGVLAAAKNADMHGVDPDVVITVGGPVVSAALKKWLRGTAHCRHWSVGLEDADDGARDTFGCLEMCVRMEAAEFLAQLSSAVQPFKNSTSSYSKTWREAEFLASQRRKAIPQLPWSDLVAVTTVLNAVPARWNVQVSNGTAIRLAQFADVQRLHRLDSNRGVSGIDGCTSTAIGAAWCYSDTTLLVTGDMSAQYDLGALALPDIPANFRMMVLSNGGGNIFRTVATTRHLPERERCFTDIVNLPLEKLADAYGFEYLRAESADELTRALRVFMAVSTRPIILDVHTDGEKSAEVYRNFIERKL